MCAENKEMFHLYSWVPFSSRIGGIVEYSEIAVERHWDIFVIRFNRPESMNCIGPETRRELVHAWTQFKIHDDLKVAVITGTGEEAFCSGGDLRRPDLLPCTPEEIDAHNSGEMDGMLGPSRWTDIYKPVIAAVNGAACAGGLEWACFADIRIAEEHATFGVTCRRWNIGLADGGTQRLPRIVGMGRAMELILTGKVIDAKEAYQMGLVNEIVPKGSSLKRAIELGRYLCSLPQEAIRTDKEAVLRGMDHPLDEGLRIEAECFNRLIGSPEMAEGVKKFITREHPDRKPGAAAVTPGLKKNLFQ